MTQYKPIIILIGKNTYKHKEINIGAGNPSEMWIVRKVKPGTCPLL
jgi:hypothetical protein